MLTIIFDGECGFCTRSVNWLKQLDRREQIKVVPYQHPGTPEAYGLTQAQCAEAVWAITNTGTAVPAAAAVNRALDTALGKQWFERIYGLPLMSRLQEWVYRWIARNRRRFPGVRPFCQQHPEQCDAGKKNML